jgi:hypothetical protein
VRFSLAVDVAMTNLSNFENHSNKLIRNVAGSDAFYLVSASGERFSASMTKDLNVAELRLVHGEIALGDRRAERTDLRL